MSFFRCLGLVAIAVASAACIEAGPGPVAPPGVLASATTIPTPPTSAPPASSRPSPSTSASSGDVFESSRHAYRAEVPVGWIVHEYDGSWEALTQFSPGGEIPGEDAIAPPDFSSFLVMNSMAIPAGMTDREWLAAFEAMVEAGLPADCPGKTQSGTFAGEPATILAQTCADSRIVGRSLVHGGRGYYFTTKSPAADPAREAVVDDLAASIEFTDLDPVHGALEPAGDAVAALERDLRARRSVPFGVVCVGRGPLPRTRQSVDGPESITRGVADGAAVALGRWSGLTAPDGHHVTGREPQAARGGAASCSA